MKRIDINDVKAGDFIYLRGGEFTTINPYYFDTAVFWSLYSLRVGIAEVISLGEDVFTNSRVLKCKIPNVPEGFEIAYQGDTALLVEDSDNEEQFI